MESILTVDMKNNPELMEDFEGVEPGDIVKVTAEFRVSQLSESRLTAPLESIISVTSEANEEDEDDAEDEDTEE